MRKSRFTESQIVRLLKEAEAGRPIALCRENAISPTTFYKWKTKFGGMEASDGRRLKELEAEHSRLKQMYAELEGPPDQRAAVSDLHASWPITQAARM